MKLSRKVAVSAGSVSLEKIIFFVIRIMMPLWALVNIVCKGQGLKALFVCRYA